MDEIWKDIKGYEGKYQVSNKGNIKSLKQFNKRGVDLIIKLGKNNTGYTIVRLTKNNKLKTPLVHRLVAQAFIPNPDNKPQVNHKNGNKADNTVENLEWVTRSENQKHAYETGLQQKMIGNLNPNYGKKGKEHPAFGYKHTEEAKNKISKNHDDRSRGKHHLARRIECVTTGEVFECIRDAADKYKVNESTVGRWCRSEKETKIKHPITGERLVWKYID